MRIGNISVKKSVLKILLILTCLFCGNELFAQDKIVPVNYSLDNASDFRQYEPDVINCIRWLAENPRNIQPKLRQKAEDFLVKWIYGCPYVNVIIEPYIMKLSSKNANLLLSFMFGYTLYQLEHLGDKNLIPANIAGINNLLKDYQLNLSSFTKDPLVDKAILLEKEGKLTEWVEPQLSKKKLDK